MKLINMIIALLLVITVNAQTKITIPSKFDVVVSFGSMCCGTASDEFLKSYIKKFSKLHKVKIPAYKASGCGKEGEFKVMFMTSKLKTSVKKKFSGELKTLIASQEKKNRAKDSSSGNINLEYNIESGEISYCRGGIVKY